MKSLKKKCAFCLFLLHRNEYIYQLPQETRIKAVEEVERIVKSWTERVNCGLPRSTIFSTLSHKRQDFKKKKVIEQKMFKFIYKFCVKHFSFEEEFREI